MSKNYCTAYTVEVTGNILMAEICQDDWSRLDKESSDLVLSINDSDSFRCRISVSGVTKLDLIRSTSREVDYCGDTQRRTTLVVRYGVLCVTE